MSTSILSSNLNGFFIFIYIPANQLVITSLKASVKAADTKGSINNDSFISENGQVLKQTNHSGGILGGISDGSSIILRAAIKPTPSIAQTQKTVNRDLDNVEIEIHGRHDPMIVPRAVVVVESMAAVTILDGVLKNLGATMDNIKKIYGE